MILNMYDTLEDMIGDLVKLSVLDEADCGIYLEETSRENHNVIFIDSEEGHFMCLLWINNIEKANDFNIIRYVVQAWAEYVEMVEPEDIQRFEACSMLSNIILSNIRMNQPE